MLRTLQGRAVGLSDATLALLCSEPPDAQTPLFEVATEAAPTSRKNRFDPRRDLRLGWNVVRGSNDAPLTETARARLQGFRSMRLQWLELMASQPLAVLAESVWAQGLARDGAPGSARALSQQLVLRRLLDRLLAFAETRPGATLGDVLDYPQARAETTLEACEIVTDDRYVHLLDIDSARGRSFDFVVIPDARAGSFPRWYVPDSFLFSPKLGMIPKENVGDASASRTAKFTYYMHRMKINKAYNDEERRAFEYAVSRATGSVLVTASGKATRGITAPEFLEELRKR
jgi:superfamily I DNA/RNA helicase